MVNFSDKVHNFLAHKMKLTVIMHLLGKLIGYKALWVKLHSLWKPSDRFYLIDLDNYYYVDKFNSGEDYMHVLMDGPWVIFGHYLTVQP